MTSTTDTGTSETGQQADNGTQQSDTGSSDKGTGAGWTPPASQAELDRIIQDRLARATAPFRDYAELKAKAEQHDALLAEMSTDQEKAAQKAQLDGYNAAMSKAVPRVVTAEFRAAAKDVLTDDQLAALLEDLNLTSYADDDGEPDTAKIAAKVAKFAPTKAGFPDLGGGNRGGTSKTLNMNDLIRQQAGHGT